VAAHGITNIYFHRSPSISVMRMYSSCGLDREIADTKSRSDGGFPPKLEIVHGGKVGQREPCLVVMIESISWRPNETSTGGVSL